MSFKSCQILAILGRKVVRSVGWCSAPGSAASGSCPMQRAETQRRSQGLRRTVKEVRCAASCADLYSQPDPPLGNPHLRMLHTDLLRLPSSPADKKTFLCTQGGYLIANFELFLRNPCRLRRQRRDNGPHQKVVFRISRSQKQVAGIYTEKLNIHVEL